jgi:NADH:ubiquinone oxidoreductase subunit F (NADH-binding)
VRSVTDVDVALPRLLNGHRVLDMAQLGHHLEVHGPLPARTDLDGRALVDLVERAGLRGRGGAGFPMSRKLAAVRAARGRPIVLANGCESEPISAKDALLLNELPHLVLDGATMAARAVGAKKVIIAFEESNLAARPSLEGAIAQRREARLDDPRFEIFEAAERFLTGQETALVSQVNGGPPRPTFIPPRPTDRGVGRRPTLVQNVETLAHLALLARHGASWFRALGTDAEPGSVLITAVGAVDAPGVYEVELGTSLPSLLEAAGGLRGELGGVLVGGYFGSWLGEGQIGELALSNVDLAEAGASLGCGAVVALPASACAVAETTRVAGYLAGENADQCGPCVHGTAAIAGTLRAIAAGEASATAFEDLARWAAELPGRGACHHPNGVARFVSTGLRAFSERFEEHARIGPCDACPAESILPLPSSSVRSAA